MTVGDGGAAARGVLREQLLGWGTERPTEPAGAVSQLRAQLEEQLGALGADLDAAVAASGRGTLVVRRTALDRVTCDAWAADPPPLVHDHASVRGRLVHRAVQRHLDGGAAAGGTAVRPAAVSPAEVVAAAWRELAAHRPGDPTSVSAWLNACHADVAVALRADATAVLETVAEVWPVLPGDQVRTATDRRFEVPLLEGRVRLRGSVDALLDSLVRDGRARALVLDLRTGLPRADRDLAAVRFHALLTALATGRLPFRWATFYVTEGRSQVEDLDLDVLAAVAGGVVDVVRQAASLARRPAGATAYQPGAVLCEGCRRGSGCDAAAASRRAIADGPAVAMVPSRPAGREDREVDGTAARWRFRPRWSAHGPRGGRNRHGRRFRPRRLEVSSRPAGSRGCTAASVRPAPRTARPGTRPPAATATGSSPSAPGREPDLRFAGRIEAADDRPDGDLALALAPSEDRPT